jgi:hypothetical protein
MLRLRVGRGGGLPSSSRGTGLSWCPSRSMQWCAWSGERERSGWSVRWSQRWYLAYSNLLTKWLGSPLLLPCDTMAWWAYGTIHRKLFFALSAAPSRSSRTRAHEPDRQNRRKMRYWSGGRRSCRAHPAIADHCGVVHQIWAKSGPPRHDSTPSGTLLPLGGSWGDFGAPMPGKML